MKVLIFILATFISISSFSEEWTYDDYFDYINLAHDMPGDIPFEDQKGRLFLKYSLLSKLVFREYSGDGVSEYARKMIWYGAVTEFYVQQRKHPSIRAELRRLPKDDHSVLVGLSKYFGSLLCEVGFNYQSYIISGKILNHQNGCGFESVSIGNSYSGSQSQQSHSNANSKVLILSVTGFGGTAGPISVSSGSFSEAERNGLNSLIEECNKQNGQIDESSVEYKNKRHQNLSGPAGLSIQFNVPVVDVRAKCII